MLAQPHLSHAFSSLHYCCYTQGIRPVYVFEGKPPELKIEQLKQRREKRDEADKELAAAKEAGDQEAIEKYSKRTTKVGARDGPCDPLG